jgi:hypothetical protein
MTEPTQTTEARIPGIVSGRFALSSANVLAMLGAMQDRPSRFRQPRPKKPRNPNKAKQKAQRLARKAAR